MPLPAKRKKLFLALRSAQSVPGSLLLAGAVSLSPGTVLAEATHKVWRCSGGAEGGWHCEQVTAPGRSYSRPFRPEPVLTEEEGPQVRQARSMDWVDEEDMTEEERARLTIGCCGAYIEPKANYPEAGLEPDKASLRVSAGSTEVQQEGTTKLEGSVQVTHGYRQLRSSSAILDQNNRGIELTGDVLFREPGLLLQGENAAVNLQAGTLNFDNVSFVLHETGTRGTAEKMSRDPDQDFIIDNATYTTCEPKGNTWLLESNELRIDQDTGIATAQHTKIRVKGVPVVYLPWIIFPIGERRTSGLLFPVLESSDENGIGYTQPIYLNLAPNYDATISPRFTSERGAMIETEGRHLSSWGVTTLAAAYLPDDDGGGDSDETVKTFQGQDRWLGGIYHQGGFNSNWFTRVNFTEVSDEEYFRDIGSATLEISSRTHLPQYAAAGYRNKHWYLNVTAQEFQTLSRTIDEQYQVRPRVTANGYYRFGDIQVELDNQFTSFEHPDNAFIRGDRVRLDYSLGWDAQWTWGYFKPTIKGKYISYHLKNPQPGSDDAPSITVPVSTIDTGIFLERDWGRFTHTFEPRLYYLSSEFEDQSGLPNFDSDLLTFSYSQLFSDDRFSGGDRVGDSEHLALGLTTRVVDDMTGDEWLRASIGQIFFFADRQVSLNSNLTESFLANPNLNAIADLQQRLRAEADLDQLLEDESSLAGELLLKLDSRWSLQLDGLFSRDRSEFDKGNLTLRYTGKDRSLVNLGYRFTNNVSRVVNGEILNNDIEQADISTFLPISGNWNLVAKWQYDITNKRDLETFAGFEYNSCCWRASLVARRWLDRDDSLPVPERELNEDNGIFLQIQFKGLGGTGTRVDSILSEGIQGYKAPDAR